MNNNIVSMKIHSVQYINLYIFNILVLVYYPVANSDSAIFPFNTFEGLEPLTNQYN